MDLTKLGIGEIIGNKSEVPLIVRHMYKVSFYSLSRFLINPNFLYL